MKYQWKKLLQTFALALGLTVHAQAAEHVTVFAAASLTNAIKDIASQHQKQTGVEITASFAASSTLALQIEKDTPADIFISADQEWMDYCVGKQKIAIAT